MSDKEILECAKKELAYYEMIVKLLEKGDFQNVLKELRHRGLEVNEDTHDISNNDREQVDLLGLFVGITLVRTKKHTKIGYAWAFDSKQTEFYF